MTSEVAVGLCFTTEMGSSYELNGDAPQVRRLQNTNGRHPTRSQGPDGHWREYAELSRYVWSDGMTSVVFTWADGAPETRTSPIVEAAPRMLALLDQLPLRRTWP